MPNIFNWKTSSLNFSPLSLIFLGAPSNRNTVLIVKDICFTTFCVSIKINLKLNYFTARSIPRIFYKFLPATTVRSFHRLLTAALSSTSLALEQSNTPLETVFPPCLSSFSSCTLVALLQRGVPDSAMCNLQTSQGSNIHG